MAKIDQTVKCLPNKLNHAVFIFFPTSIFGTTVSRGMLREIISSCQKASPLWVFANVPLLVHLVNKDVLDPYCTPGTMLSSGCQWCTGQTGSLLSWTCSGLLFHFLFFPFVGRISIFHTHFRYHLVLFITISVCSLPARLLSSFF